MRDLYVTVDGGEERTLLYGGTTEFAAAPGEHRVSVSNRLRTQGAVFTVEAGETARFVGGNVFSGGCFAPLVLLLTTAYGVTLERLD